MDMNPGFELIKKAFNELAEKIKPEEVKQKFVKSVAAAGETFIEKLETEFPKERVEQVINDVYAFIGSRDVADGISLTAQSVSPEDIQGALDQVVESLKDDKVAEGLAQQLKQIADQDGGVEGLTGLIESQVEDLPLPQQMMVKMMVAQLEPALEQVKHMDKEEVKEMIKQGVDAIPTEEIAMQLYAVAQNVTPERVSAVAQEVTGNLPSADSVSGVLYGLAGAAKKQFGEASQTGEFNAEELANDAQNILANAASKDATSKKTINKKKGIDFDF